MPTYREELTAAMTRLGAREDVVFLGQAVRYAGTGMFETLAGVNEEKRIEMPVAEDLQLGTAIGLALGGYLPVCVYPRWNFLLLATNQLVLHLDKLPEYGNGYRPKVLIRTAVATADPLDPGPQHLGDFSGAYRRMLRNVQILEIHHPNQVRQSYDWALASEHSAILVEYVERYDT